MFQKNLLLPFSGSSGLHADHDSKRLQHPHLHVSLTDIVFKKTGTLIHIAGGKPNCAYEHTSSHRQHTNKFDRATVQEISGAKFYTSRNNMISETCVLM
jgi:hypothetical protein